VRDEAGEVIRYEGTLRDITDQKRAEDAVAEGRRLLQQVIDTVPAVINVKDRNLRYVLMNRYMAGIFSVDPKDAIGRTTSDLMSRYGAQKTDDNDRRVLQLKGGLGFYEEYVNGHRLIGHGGDLLFFHTNLMLIPEANVGIFVFALNMPIPLWPAIF